MIQKIRSLLISELVLRRLVGVLGIALPFALLWAGGFELRPSMSDYYYSDMGLPTSHNLFEGVMCAVGVFLCTYRGWDVRDQALAMTAGLMAILVALVPCAPEGSKGWDEIRGYFHLGFAAVFLLALAYISYFQFTKTKNIKTMTPQKKSRNFIYRTCAVVMAACLLAIVIYDIFLKPDPAPKAGPVFFLEAAAVIAFGFSWLIKGEALFPDKGRRNQSS